MSVRLPSLAFASLLVATLVNGCGLEQHQRSSQPNLNNVSIRSQSDVQAIQGGTLDTTSSNVVGILINMNGGIAICTGSLIAPNLVLTAHHCVANDGPGDIGNCSASGHFGTQLSAASFRVTMNSNAPAGVFNSGQWPAVDNNTWYGVSAVATSGTSICGGDMAVLRLTNNITSVCPLIPRVDSAPGLNEGFTAVGFGATSQSQTAPAGTRYTLNGFMSIACPDNCGQGMSQTQEWYGVSSVTNRGVCEGDSGGPALDSQRRVLGTVSRGSASACNEAVYESVFGLSTWIKQQAAAAATAGGYPAAGWVNGSPTSINPCTGMDGGTGGGGGATGGGGGTTGGGGGTTGGGGGTGTCPSGQMCVDVTQGMNVFECISNTGGIPANAPTCSGSQACPSGSTCFATMQGATTGICLIDCGSTGTGGGGGTPVGGGGGATGGGGGLSMGSCTAPNTVCVDASGMGDFACLDTTTQNGIPANAPACPCTAGSSCWQTSGGNVCLQDCTTGGTGGGGGTPVGGGTGGGVTGGGTGGGVTGGGTGGGVVGGGTGGGVVGGGTGGGVTGGGTGGGATGGGTGGGTTGGGTGGSSGGGTGAGTGAGVQGGGFMFPGLPEQPKKTGCSCTEVPFDAMALALSGMIFFRRRRRSTR